MDPPSALRFSAVPRVVRQAKNMSATSVGLTVAASGFLVATAIVEESENLRFFGESYAADMKTTRRFVPYLF